FFGFLGFFWVFLSFFGYFGGFLRFFGVFNPEFRCPDPDFGPPRSDCERPGPELCSFPSANVSLLGEHREKVLLYGQLYRISLELELPESPVNRELGMFMVRLTCYGSGGKTLATASRSAMLHYRSRLLRALHTAAFAGLFLSGFAEQSQTLELELLGRYREDPVANPSPGTAPGVAARWAGPVSSVINYKIEVNAAHPLFIPGRTGSGSIRDGKQGAQPLWAPQTSLPSRRDEKSPEGTGTGGPWSPPGPTGAAGGIPALQLCFPLIPAPPTAAAGLGAVFPKEKSAKKPQLPS
uniref:Seipin n=1 Tax=Cyanistes caeruleus TaxID=156563 RepID=A0A8C0VT10_CYACU